MLLLWLLSPVAVDVVHIVASAVVVVVVVAFAVVLLLLLFMLLLLLLLLLLAPLLSLLLLFVSSNVNVTVRRPICRWHWFLQHILHSKWRQRRCGRCFVHAHAVCIGFYSTSVHARRSTCRLYGFCSTSCTFDMNARRPTCRLYWFLQHILHSKWRQRRCGRYFGRAWGLGVAWGVGAGVFPDVARNRGEGGGEGGGSPAVSKVPPDFDRSPLSLLS